MAGAEAIRSQDPNGVITCISNDPNAYYFRAALTNYLSGQLRNDQLWGVPAGWYADKVLHRIRSQATGIDVGSQCVHLDDSSVVPYDRLLIASGASPIML